jgi:hypothetical protein
MRHAGNLIDREHECQPMAGLLEICRAHDLMQDRIALVRVGEGENDLLLGLDGDAEDRLLLVNARAAAEHNGTRNDPPTAEGYPTSPRRRSRSAASKPEPSCVHLDSGRVG